MTRQEIERKTKAILAKLCSYSVDEIGPETELSSDLGLNSFKSAELREKVERAFGISVFDDDLFSFEKFSDLIDMIDKKVKES